MQGMTFSCRFRCGTNKQLFSAAHQVHPRILPPAMRRTVFLAGKRTVMASAGDGGLALQLVEKGIRVNRVAPGPIWMPLIPASFTEEETKNFGTQVPMKRAGQPIEVAPCFVFLACNSCSSYITGQVLHPNGGTIVNA